MFWTRFGGLGFGQTWLASLAKGRKGEPCVVLGRTDIIKDFIGLRFMQGSGFRVKLLPLSFATFPKWHS